MHSQLFAAIARNSFCSHLLWEQKRGIPLWKKCNISAIFQQLYHRKNLFVNRCNCTKYAFQFVQINNFLFSPLQTPIHGKNTLPIRVFLPQPKPELSARGKVKRWYIAILCNLCAQIFCNYFNIFARYFQVIFNLIRYFHFMHNPAFPILYTIHTFCRFMATLPQNCAIPIDRSYGWG